MRRRHACSSAGCSRRRRRRSSWSSRRIRWSSPWRAARRWCMRAMPARVLADALPGVMLGQSDMLGGGPVSELASHPDERRGGPPSRFRPRGRAARIPGLARVQRAAGHAAGRPIRWVTDSPRSRHCRPIATSSVTSCPTLRPRSRARWIRGGRGWARRSCAGKARVSAPTGSSDCSTTRSRPIPSR